MRRRKLRGKAAARSVLDGCRLRPCEHLRRSVHLPVWFGVRVRRSDGVVHVQARLNASVRIRHACVHCTAKTLARARPS